MADCRVRIEKKKVHKPNNYEKRDMSKTQCYKCNKMGHFARNCRVKIRPKGQIRAVGDDNQNDDQEDMRDQINQLQSTINNFLEVGAGVEN